MMITRILPLIAAATALSSAQAGVTFTKVGVSSSSWISIGSGAGTYQYGPVQESTVIGSGYYTSVGNFHQGDSFETVDGRGATGAEFTGPDHADFLVSARSVAAAVPNTSQASGYVNANVFYDFYLDTSATLSLSYLATDASFTGADVVARLFSRKPSGFADTYYLDGQLAGSGLLSYTVPAGNYSFQATASALPYLLDHVPFVQNNTDLQSVEFSLGIKAKPEGSVMPEPGSWALMITGFGFIGTALRRRSVIKPRLVGSGGKRVSGLLLKQC